jgi:hypothetical protein
MAHLRLEISDELKTDIQQYANKYGISVAAAVRILIHNQLMAEHIDSARAAAGVAP